MGVSPGVCVSAQGVCVCPGGGSVQGVWVCPGVSGTAQGVSARGCLPRGRVSPLPPWTDKHLGKHNLSPTTVADGTNGDSKA